MIYVVLERYDVKHPCLVCGQPVKCAGTFHVKKNKVAQVSNDSGHYKPTLEQARAFARHVGLDPERDVQSVRH